MIKNFSQKMNPLTLYFERSLENGYALEKSTKSIKELLPYSIALSAFSFIFGLVVPASQYHYVLRDPVYISIITSIILIPISSIALSHFKSYAKYYEEINVLGGWFSDLLTVAIFLIAPIAFVRAFFAISILKLIIYAVSTNFRLPAAVISATGSALIYFFQFHKVKAYPTIEGGPYVAIGIYVGSIFAVFAIVRGLEIVSRSNFLKSRELELEKVNSLRNLHSSLPQFIAKKIHAQGDTFAESHQDAGILFANLVGLTAIAEKMPASKIVSNLNNLYAKIDALASAHGILKIRISGDVWLGASGIHEYSPEHANKLMQFASALLKAIDQFREESNLPVRIRIGIHAGPVVSGIIGTERPSFEVWGQTVDLAGRLAQTSTPDTIQVSDDFRALVRTEAAFAGPFSVDAKELGRLNTWRKGA